MIRRKLIEQEGFEVPEEELNDYIEQYARDNNMDTKRVRIEYRSNKKRENLKNILLDNKVYGYLAGKADIRTVK